jgi:PAS domain S-box-containing protein|tara:strand:- start:8895 stop:9959 length:1065 start_codon:yes stop_codon:yes gene_type:complete
LDFSRAIPIFDLREFKTGQARHKNGRIMSEKIPPQTGLGGGLAVAAAFMIGGAMVGAAVYIAHAVIYGTEVVPFVVPARAFLFGGATIAVLAYFVGKSKSLAFQRLRDQGHAIEELEAAVAERTAELRASEERLRVQFKGLPAPTYTWQRTGDDFQLIDYNDAADSYTRGAVSEAKGSMLSEMYRNMPELIGDIRRCLDEKTGIEREMVYPYQSIGQRHLNVKYAYVPPDLVMVHTEDITERKLAEAAVKESERRYRSLYNETPVMMHSIDLSGKLLDANEYWLETLGYQREEVVGTSDMAFFTEASRKYALEVNLPAFAKNGFCRDVPYQLIKKNGEIIDVLLSAVAQKNEDG